MNLKSWKYMKSAEFKARQLWLGFEDAAGIVLKALESSKEQAWAWFKAWRDGFVSMAVVESVEAQLCFVFENRLDLIINE